MEKTSTRTPNSRAAMKCPHSCTVINTPKVTVIRDGNSMSLTVSELVLDDVMDLLPGQQIVADSVVLTASNLEVDESLLTGESDPMVKAPGDELLAGSFVVAGNSRAAVSKVGVDAYAAKLAEQARKFTLVHSELRTSIDRIADFWGWLYGHVLEIIIIALLLIEAIFMGFDVMLRLREG